MEAWGLGDLTAFSVHGRVSEPTLGFLSHLTNFDSTVFEIGASASTLDHNWIFMKRVTRGKALTETRAEDSHQPKASKLRDGVPPGCILVQSIRVSSDPTSSMIANNQSLSIRSDLISRDPTRPGTATGPGIIYLWSDGSVCWGSHCRNLALSLPRGSRHRLVFLEILQDYTTQLSWLPIHTKFPPVRHRYPLSNTAIDPWFLFLA